MPSLMQMGCVAWPDMEEPPLGLVRCLRRDLITPAAMTETALWSGASSDNQYWRCSIWPVQNPARTFLAAKSDSRPAPQLARTPVYY
jgi:vacuolar protein sorting-associated protein 13A/C